jgi:PST family polysaccharide transporter
VAYFLFTGHLSVLSIIATQSVLAGVFATMSASRAGFSFKRLKTSVLEIRAPWKSYALMGLVPMVLTPLVLTFVRSFVGSTMGWDAAGIWQGIYKISDFIATLLSASLGVIVLPKISAELSRQEFSKMFRPIFIRMVAFSLVMVLALYFCRGIVVTVFLSSAYAGVADYMGVQLVGDFFRSAGWCLGFVLIARQATKAFLSIEIVAQLFFAVSSVVLVKLIEFNGLMTAYALENLLTLVALVFAVRRLKWNTP